MSIRKLKSTAALALALLVASGLSACNGLKPRGSGGDDAPEMPGARTGFLPAKGAAFRHAMARMPDEDKRYGDQYYAVAGIHDPDPSHEIVLVKALADMHPPVTVADEIYTRDQSSKWFDGRPAMVWTSRVERVTDDVHVFLIVGWTHSTLLYEFYEYEVRWLKRSDSWIVANFKPIQQAGF